MKTADSRFALGAFALAATAAVAAYWGMADRLLDVFAAPQEDMSHGYLVPFFSLYVLWTERGAIRRAVRSGAPSWGGLALLALSMAMLVFGSRGIQVRLEALSFMVFAVALPWALWGRATVRLTVFPAGFLAFMIPLSTYLDVVTVHLRLFASRVAVVVLNGFGIEAVRQGTIIRSVGANSFAIDVAEPCSGIRSLFAMMALTAAYAWFAHPTWKRRAALFACSVPLAVAGNVVRIISICLVAGYASADVALGYYHDYSGYVVFVVAILLMLACSDLIARLSAGRGARRTASAPSAPAPAAPVAAEGRPRLKGWPRLLPAALSPLLVVATAAVQRVTPPPALAEAPVAELPAALPGCSSERIFYCQREACRRSFPESDLDPAAPGECPACGAELHAASLAEATILPADTMLAKRVYVAEDGNRFLVTMVVGGASKSSIHRPELCLPAQGFAMSSPHSANFGGVPFRMITLDAPAGGARSLFAYTFFNQEGCRTASHLVRIIKDVWDRTALNRIDRWVMVTLSMQVPDGVAPARAEEALGSFAVKLKEGLGARANDGD